MSTCPEQSSWEDSLCQIRHHTPVSRKARAKLKEADVLDIFHCKTHLMSASRVSKKYGVSEKAVRDIWTGRTWSKETWHLDASRSLPLKKMGRPVGRKDAKPRKPRIMHKKLDSSTLCHVAAVTGSHFDRHHDKSVDEQLHEWNQRCGVDCDFQDPFACDLAVHDPLLQELTQHERDHRRVESGSFRISDQERTLWTSWFVSRSNH